MTLETLISSIIKQHRKKYGIANGYYYLTAKQAKFYDSLYCERVKTIEKLDSWNDGKFKLVKDALDKPTLYRYGKKFNYSKPISSKSYSILTNKSNSPSRVWVSSINLPRTITVL